MNPFVNAPARLTAKAKVNWETAGRHFIEAQMAAFGVEGSLSIRASKPEGMRAVLMVSIISPTGSVETLYKLKKSLKEHRVHTDMLYGWRNERGYPEYQVFWPMTPDAKDVRYYG